MIVLNLPMPESNFDCPFLEQDYDDTLWCYLNPSEECYGLCKKGCPIVKSCCVMSVDLNHEGECNDQC